MTNKAVEKSLRSQLRINGYKLLSDPKKNGETGEDLIAEKDNRITVFEIIGYKTNGPARSLDFYQVFFRAISRIDKFENAKIVIALCSNFQRGMKQRTDQYGSSWIKIGNAFPEIEVWFVKDEEINASSWNDLKNI